KTWRFHLRRDVHFHDGRPFGADDVVWSWTQRDLLSRLVETTLGPGSVRKIDEFTVDFIPTVPNLRLPEQVSSLSVAIVPRDAHNDSNPPVGTGPFRVVEYRPRQRVVVERFDAYWGERARERRLSFVFLPDVESRIDALKAGKVHVALQIPPETVPALEADDRFRIARSPPVSEHVVLINRSQGLASEKAVREAVSVALDRSAYATSVLKGTGEPGRSMVPHSALGAAADLFAQPRHDPAEARRILDDAGWRVGAGGIRSREQRPLHLVLVGGPLVSEEGLSFVQSQLRGVGIQTNIKHAVDRLTSDEHRLQPFDLDLRVLTQGGASPLGVPAAVGYSRIPEAQPFAPGAAFDGEVERALAAATPEEVQARSAQLMRILVEDEHVVVPLAELPLMHAMTRQVELIDPSPSLGQQLWSAIAFVP
ncbi:MAG: ABC transporter substrate-binding protein, partial [Actinobacteria bacterium]|nr:ABC transporter substrate-binding protein [Actinomycetota bacterium]